MHAAFRGFLFVVAAIAVLLAANSLSTSNAQNVAQPIPVRWEYRVDGVNDQTAFNQLGREGWELVTVNFNGPAPVRSIFKRPIR